MSTGGLGLEPRYLASPRWCSARTRAAELPYALIGFATDYANGVKHEPTRVDDLVRLMGESSGRFGAVLPGAAPPRAG